MKISIINIANKMPAWIQSACEEYLQRINHGPHSCQIIELKADKKSHKPVTEVLAIEMKKISAMLPKDSYIIALDERGQCWNNAKLAQVMASASQEYTSLCFIIGGADGLAPQLKHEAMALLSLSNLVFPHGLVRVILLEQIYRSISILENHPYHRV